MLGVPQDGVRRVADPEGVPGDARGAARCAGHEQQLRLDCQQADGLSPHRRAHCAMMLLPTFLVSSARMANVLPRQA